MNTFHEEAFVIADRAMLVRRGLVLNWVTIAYNLLEASVSMSIGAVVGSVALLGFGVDSAIEVAASIAAQWRLRSGANVTMRERAEVLTARVIGGSFLALAVYVTYESIDALWHHEAPERSTVGVVILALSVVVMPVLARAKGHIADALNSGSLRADATQTSVCAYLSGIALGGVALNMLCGWWWADPVAALAMVPLITKEGIVGVRGETPCIDCTR